MSEKWTFTLVRSRDGYRTTATLPKSEYPDHGAALRRVWSEFDPGVWWVEDEGKLKTYPESVSNQVTDPANSPLDTPDDPMWQPGDVPSPATCPDCKGFGMSDVETGEPSRVKTVSTEECFTCDGTGRVPSPATRRDKLTPKEEQDMNPPGACP